MATGIQTGLRRGARTTSNDTAKADVWTRVATFYRGLSRGAVMSAIGAAFVMLLGAAALGARNHHTGYVDLYPVKLAAHEVPEISRALLAAGIEHETTPSSDGILLARQDRSHARSLLTGLQLPRHRVLTAEEAKADFARGAAEKREQAQRLLEGEITLALREVEGIRDARVKIAVPEKTYFQDRLATTASVTLTTEPGAQFNAATIKGISSMVAFSVPGLVPEKVVLLDTSGRELSAMLTSGANPSAQGAHFEVLANEETRRQKALQQVLDAAYPGRTRAVVALEMDFSEAEKRLYTPGAAEDRGMVKDSFQLVTEMLEGTGGSQTSKGDKNYDSHKESVKYRYMENYYASLTKHARVVRTSAAVMADGFTPAEAAALKETVRGVLGMRDEQGDFVNVNSSPWDHELANDPAPLPLPEAGGSSAFSGLGVLGLLLGQGVLLCGLGAVVLYHSRRRPVPGPLGATAGVASIKGIVDPRGGKVGETVMDFPTSVSRNETLAGIVKERPAQVADLLRSTWLS